MGIHLHRCVPLALALVWMVAMAGMAPAADKSGGEGGAPAEEVPNPPVTVTIRDAALGDALVAVGEAAGVSIVAQSWGGSTRDAAGVRRSFTFAGTPLKEALAQICKAYGGRCYYKKGFFRVLRNPPVVAGRDEGAASALAFDALLQKDTAAAGSLVMDAVGSLFGVALQWGMSFLDQRVQEIPPILLEDSLTPEQLERMAGDGLSVRDLTPVQQGYLRAVVMESYFLDVFQALGAVHPLLEPPTGVHGLEGSSMGVRTFTPSFFYDPASGQYKLWSARRLYEELVR